MIRAFLGSVSFLTILPARGKLSLWSLRLFPLVGTLIGLVLGSVWVLLESFLSPSAVAGVLTVLDAVITGGLHLDAVCDSGDGLSGHMDRQSRLAAMADPRVGAFGVIWLGSFELIRYVALDSSIAKVLAMGICYGISRSIMALASILLRGAKSDSIISAFTGAIDRPYRLESTLFIGLQVGVLVGLAVFDDGWRAVLAIALGVVGSIAILVRAKTTVGGVTGDIVGAAGIAFEVIFLLIRFG